MINVQVAYATLKKQIILDIKVEDTFTILQAIEKSEISSMFDAIDMENLDVGVFSKKRHIDDIVKDGDRIEIYHKLKVTENIEPAKGNKIQIDI